MKYVKKFENFRINEEEVPSGKLPYKSDYVDAKGNFSKDEMMILKTIDCLRDAGFDCRDSSGEITDGADVWTISGIALKPDYDKKSLRIQRLRDLKVFGEVGFSTPEKMAEEIASILKSNL